MISLKNKIIIILTIIVILSLSALYILNPKFNQNSPQKPEEKQEEKNKPYGYDMLNEFEQQLYDYMEKRELKLDEIYYFDEEKDYYSIEKVQYLYRKHNYYLCSDYCYVTVQEDIPGMHEKQLPAIGIKAARVLFPDPDWKIKKETVELKAKEIVNNMPKNLTKLEQIQYLYDYVMENVEYEDIPENDISGSYSGLILGKAVCEGYARSFTELAKAAGFNVLTVYGDVGVNYQGHAWNMIEYEGNWYYLDATWDDSKYDRYFYSYFMLSEEEHENARLCRNIHFSEDIPAPKANKKLSKRVRTTIIRSKDRWK